MDISHCPNPECPQFSPESAENWYIHYGFHQTKAFGRVQRYRCRVCRRTFSTQTFSIDYYAKKRIDYQSLQDQLISASGLLDMGRNLNLRPETIQNRIERLARCSLAVHSEILQKLPFKENLAADGFESFTYSQYFPDHVNIFAGSSSEFIYAQGFANLRRKGRMTARQKEKRKTLEEKKKADPKAVEKSFRNLSQDLTYRYISKGITDRVLFTDEHMAYPRAFQKVKDLSGVFSHQTIPSRKDRTFENPLFPVNYIDRQYRKDLSDHARETVQFAHCPSAMMARMEVYRYFHNCVIPRRIRESRRGDNKTHAEQAGLSPGELADICRRHMGRRAFLGKVELGAEEMKTWLMNWRNPGIELGRYVPKYISV
jgi:transposase-like protein